MRRIILFVFCILFSAFLIKADFVLADQNPIELHFFYSSSCPHCAKEEELLNEMENKYPELLIKRYEVSSAENQKLYLEMGRKYEIDEEILNYGSVPLTFVGEKYFIGYRDYATNGKEIESYIKSLITGEENTCPGPNEPTVINLFGLEIKLSSQTSLLSLAVIFGLVDGVNPCMISVLLMLLAYLLTTGSFKEAIRAGIVFGLCVFLIYFGLMVAVYQSVCLIKGNLLSLINPLKMILGSLLVLVGIIMIKDFFYLKPGQKVSLAIPEFAQPYIKKLVGLATLPAVVLLALLSSLVELPCSFALPLGYSTILAEKSVSPYPYFALYNFFFVLPLFVIVALVGFGFLKADRMVAWKERTKKMFRFIAGVLLVVLGLLLIFKIF